MYNPYRCTGKRWDDDTEAYDMGFRNYNPSIARFDTRDMYADAAQDIGLAMSHMMRYAFTGGNPISYSDLDGHFQAQVGGTGRSINDKIVQVPTMANPKPDHCTRTTCGSGSTKKNKKVLDELYKRWLGGDQTAYFNATPAQQQKMRARNYSQNGWKPELAIDGFFL
ncbi:hypothetical protein IC619_013940 [Hazenella sp. IB182353]|uniref:RHS repeat-associated core domain-containing protein n=1 Tax=Polycladospora coralii TaxID=2771432 RepID=UPI001747287A|nr:RHS repeat-associated core domain-containing protein [Polycladospora coralii]MBS7531584.1 hypothetical protein [Polycladospora coralii]